MSKMLDGVDGWMVSPFLDCYDYQSTYGAKKNTNEQRYDKEKNTNDKTNPR